MPGLLSLSFAIRAFQNQALFEAISLVIPRKSLPSREDEDGQTAWEGQVPLVCSGSKGAVNTALALPVTQEQPQEKSVFFYANEFCHSEAKEIGYL